MIMLILERILVSAESGRNALQMRRSRRQTLQKAKQVNNARALWMPCTNFFQILQTTSRR